MMRQRKVKYMDNKFSLYYELLNIIEEQDRMICNLNKKICNIVKENIEKENLINVLMEELKD